jgi:HAD superfamily, subfamily IIIB (Acid phosphatase)
MRRFTITLVTAAVLAVAPAAASAQSQQIPAPGPILTKLGSTPMVELWDGGGGLPYLGAANSYNAGDWEAALRLYHSSGVYDQQIAKVDDVAQRWLKRTGRHGGSHFRFKRKRHARGVKLVRVSRRGHDHGGGHRRPAIVFDVDETVLSNYTAIDADNFTFGPNSQAEATDEIGTAIAPSLALYKLAQRKGIATFFITGRRESTRAHTAHNLEREGFTDYSELVLKPEAFTGSTVDYKAGARRTIESQGYRIVASVGDQYSDLAGGHEDVAFKLPNPFYFLP